MTNAEYTAIALLVDRSGSTASIKSDMDGGIASLLKDQSSEPGKATLWLADFDDRYTQIYDNVDLNHLPSPAYEVRPRGMTALLDSMARAINEFGSSLAAMDEDERPGKVIFAVVTDGLENASREWTKEQVFALVSEQSTKYSWDFLYLGAGQDAIAVAGGIGIRAGAALTFNQAGTGASYAAASAYIHRSRRGKRADFTDEERSAAEAEGQLPVTASPSTMARRGGTR